MFSNILRCVRGAGGDEDWTLIWRNVIYAPGLRRWTAFTLQQEDREGAKSKCFKIVNFAEKKNFNQFALTNLSNSPAGA